MRTLVVISLFFLTAAAQAGMLSVEPDGSATTSIGGEIRYFKLETTLGKPHLFVVDSKNQACRIPVDLMKDLGIDPVQFGLSLRNVSGNDGLVLTCYVTAEEFNRRVFAYKIDVSSWPRP